ncbi:MAG: hypothetical protein GF401_00895 [Chitinivibrionales bacterium]|nr:hypothetical protein [Chitinivibrionales bacterium]
MRFSTIVLLLTCVNFTAFGLSGIAVSDFVCSEKEQYWIDAHFIEDDVWQDSIILATSSRSLGVRDPAINSHGTHCAFIRGDGNSWTICVTRIGGKNKMVKELTTVDYHDDRTHGEIYSMLIYWPRGDWIWFSDEFDYSGVRLGATSVSRVNVHTGEVQNVLTFPPTHIWHISGDTRWMASAHCRIGLHRVPDVDSLIANDAAPAALSYDCADWNDGGNRIFNDGCGQSVSINGRYIYYNNSNIHENVRFTAIDSATGEATRAYDFNKWDWNDWAVDTTTYSFCDIDPSTGQCAEWKPVEYIGCQLHTLSDWAVNSEKWTCMTLGWGGMGRYMEDGGNIVTMNPEQEKSLLLTNHPPKNDSINNPDGDVRKVWHGALWISAPEEDIAPGYMEDILNRDSYHIEGTDSLAGQIPITIPVEISEVAGKGCLSRAKDNTWTIILPHEGRYTAKVYDARGKQVSQVNGFGSRAIVPAGRLAAGIHFALIEMDDMTRTFALTGVTAMSR